jgi:hypothetical protein
LFVLFEIIQGCFIPFFERLSKELNHSGGAKRVAQAHGRLVQLFLHAERGKQPWGCATRTAAEDLGLVTGPKTKTATGAGTRGRKKQIFELLVGGYGRTQAAQNNDMDRVIHLFHRMRLLFLRDK